MGYQLTHPSKKHCTIAGVFFFNGVATCSALKPEQMEVLLANGVTITDLEPVHSTTPPPTAEVIAIAEERTDVPPISVLDFPA